MKKIFSIILISVFIDSISFAEIYRCVDSQGNVTHSTTPGYGCVLFTEFISKQEKTHNYTKTILFAKVLYDEFSENEVAALNKYKGIDIFVLGEVDSVKTNIANKPIVYLKAGTHKYIACRFNEKMTSRILNLKNGQVVIIDGYVENMATASVFMKNCTLHDY